MRVNITLPPVLYEAGTRLAKDGGYSGLSDYFQACIRTNAGIGPIHLTAVNGQTQR